MVKPALFLIPTPLGEASTPALLSHEKLQVVTLTDFVVEAEKTARAHLKALGVTTPLRSLNLQVLNEHTPLETINQLLTPLNEGRSMGLMSEAGCPAVADPGALLVAAAHEKGFEIKPLVGPSSIIMALMASGANGQCFTFKGYIPSAREERLNALKNLEKESAARHETQIFIETPYRNDAMLSDALAVLKPTTRLCVAADLTLPTQIIVSQTVRAWRKRAPLDLKKRPAIFIIDANT